MKQHLYDDKEWPRVRLPKDLLDELASQLKPGERLRDRIIETLTKEARKGANNDKETQ